jgi:hypothetical protein
MLRVTIELLLDGGAELARTLAVIMVANDDTGTPMNGHYDVKLTHIEADGSTHESRTRRGFSSRPACRRSGRGGPVGDQSAQARHGES